MKNIAILLCSFSIIGVLTMGCNLKQTGQNTSSSMAASPTAATGKLAYVNIDTLEAKYDLWKNKLDELKKRQEEMENELQISYSEMQNDANDVQKKVEANTLTQSEYEAAQKRLMQMQKSLETRKQSLTDQLMKEEEAFNKDLKERINQFIEGYNKDKHYDFIFTYTSANSSFLYVNKALDITKDVVDGMNATSKSDDNKKNK